MKRQAPRHPFTLPVVDPVGVLQAPAGWRRRSAAASQRRRSLAMVVLAIFAAMTLATGALSLGAYCLTSDGADGRRLATPVR
ncbi:MAG TPA: hypothetical protein VN923_07820 [Thermoanaerobaculia bacterium]|nr:hypothetical protein [Thermoanaerobaculia bacterium]